MKHRHYTLLLFTLLLALVSCKKIVIPEDTKNGGGDTPTEEPEGPIDFRGYATLEDYLDEYGSLDLPIPCEDLLPGG